MRVSWARRMMVACIPTVATVAALAAPGAAHAELLLQCEGSSILGRGSTLQGAVAQDKVWNPDFNEVLGVPNKNGTACGGTQGTGAKPKVEYLQEPAANRGSGSCLKAFGSGLKAGEKAKFGEFTYCGTDEAPNETQKGEIEAHAEGVEKLGESLETLPVLQAPVAVIVHLPKSCTASAEYKEGEKTVKLGRLVLRDKTLEEIYRGTVGTWKEVIEKEEPVNKDKLAGTGCKPEEPITRVVRQDKSGTTHIFKTFLAAVNRLNAEGVENKAVETTFPAEKFEGKEEENKTWKEVASGSENARWPAAAKVARPASSGGPEVVALVASTESSIGYANLADAFENGKFDKKLEGGGEKQNKFWVMLQDQTETAKAITYTDPAVKKDTETHGNGNCGKTVYTDGEEVFPPTSTLKSWSKAQSKLNVATYALCGLTYDLALREYAKYTKETESVPTEAQATTVESYLLFELNTKTEGGGKLIENNEYEKLPSSLLDEVEDGVEEIGYTKSGVKFTCTKEAAEGTGTLFYKSLKECETLNAPGSKGLYHR